MHWIKLNHGKIHNSINILKLLKLPKILFYAQNFLKIGSKNFLLKKFTSFILKFLECKTSTFKYDIDKCD